VEDFQTYTDEELVGYCKEVGFKDDRPYSTLFRRYSADVWRLAFSILGDSRDAEDLVQIVFDKAFRHIKQFEGRSSLKTWLFQITMNSVRNEIRRRKTRPLLENIEMDVIDQLQDKSVGNQFIASKHSDHFLLADAWQQLRESDQQILLLKDIEGRSYEQIADMKDIKLSAAKMRVQRARLALRDLYLQMEVDDGNE